MPRLFEPGLVYPSDRVGPYVDLEGVVTEVGNPLGGDVSVKVQTKDHGIFTGFTVVPAPKVGYKATVRVYNAGGGWYPDNCITSWSSQPRTSKEGEELTAEEMVGLRGKKLTEAQCPDCKNLGFLAGPCGGGSQNFKCASTTCSSRFNDKGPFGIERISDARPDAPPDVGNTPYRGNTRFDRDDPV